MHLGSAVAIKAVTFDVYSALYDARAGLTGAVEALFRIRGVAGDAQGVARTWRERQRGFLQLVNSLDREPASNRRGIEAAARYALRYLRPAVSDDEVRALTSAWERLPPWPEVASVLQEIRRRPLVLGTLSNGDADMLRALLANLPVRFDHIISTEGGKFKPHPSVYRKALDTLGVHPAELLHVAGSGTDAMGATAAGIETVWVNRMNDAVDDPRFAPAHETSDLWGVVQVLDIAR